MRLKPIPGVSTEASSDLPVLLPYDAKKGAVPDSMLFTRWLANMPPWTPLVIFAVILLWPLTAQAAYSYGEAMDALWRWMPFLVLHGFSFNVLISFLAMVIGTALENVMMAPLKVLKEGKTEVEALARALIKKRAA